MVMKVLKLIYRHLLKYRLSVSVEVRTDKICPAHAVYLVITVIAKWRVHGQSQTHPKPSPVDFYQHGMLNGCLSKILIFPSLTNTTQLEKSVKLINHCVTKRVNVQNSV